ncbi:hypothetical protein D3C78_1784910 [compost metagenome]
MHVEEDFVVLRLRTGDFFENQVFGGAEGFAQHGFHRRGSLLESSQCRGLRQAGNQNRRRLCHGIAWAAAKDWICLPATFAECLP